MSAAAVKTTCPYCGVGCGVLATPRPDGSAEIAGDPDHPANFGRLCSKGSALGDTLALEGRLLHPEIDGQRANWDAALDLVAGRFADAIAAHGPDAVAIYGSGQLLTEDYYVANKLMKGFVGSANIDTNSRLCMASTVAGHKRAFGADTVPGNYEDLETADLVILVGSNLAWCHPVLYQRIAAAKRQRPEMRIVLIDPRRTASADIADLHLATRADGDSALFVGLLGRLADCLDEDFVKTHTAGAEAALAVAAQWPPARVAQTSGVAEPDLETFYEWFAGTERVVTVFSQGVNQSASGTDKVNAIINCHLLTGRIGRPGMGPFSVTGQPNAMGGREVGGLANMLAAHMDFTEENIARLGRFWRSQRVATTPGYKAVDLFRACARGEIKALWIMATNPVVSMPEADAVRAAIAACPFVVVSDINARTDTTLAANVRLPAAGWGEKSGTVTNSERRISRQRPFLPLPGEARPDWWIISEVGKRLGFADAFAFQSPADIFAEHAALSGFENEGHRDFDLSGLIGADYEALPPTQWPTRPPGPTQPPGSARPPGPARPAGTARLFADGQFFTPDSRARFVPVEPPVPPAPPAGQLVLNTGRVRDHWHTMTRTGKAAKLSAHMAEPYAEIHPDDAAARGIAPASLVRVHNDRGEVLVRALVSARAQRGAVFVPMHWTGETSAKGRVDALVAGEVDPFSGQPALKMSSAWAEPAPVARYGFFVTRLPPKMDSSYWALAVTTGGYRGELAWFAEPADFEAWFRDAFSLGRLDIQTATDPARGRRHFAALDAGRLVAALFTAPEPVAVARHWVTELLSAEAVRSAEVLAGRPGDDLPDTGAVVCACFGVGINTIIGAVQQGCTSAEAVGAATKAGTNCGSCRAEIGAIIAAQFKIAAE